MNDEKVEPSWHAGRFQIGDKEVYGQLTFANDQHFLYLRDEEFVPVHSMRDQYIKGILNDLTRVSLLRCYVKSGPGTASRNGERYSFAKVVPQFVIVGDEHIGPNDNAIVGIDVEIDDADTLFYDFDAFAHSLNPELLIKPLVEAQAKVVEREIPIGPEPEIFYFTGKRQIFSANTVLGTISASHNPTYPLLSNPKRLFLNNTILVSIDTPEPITFNETLRRLVVLVQYLGLLVGRPQNFPLLRLRLLTTDSDPRILQVYSATPLHRDIPGGFQTTPDVSDILLDAVNEPEHFSQVLAAWLTREEAWRDARGRFFDCFAKQRNFNPDRLIAAANLFDVLPDSTFTKTPPLSDELQAAKKASKHIFSSLSNESERIDALNTLGRIGRSPLREKIRQRVEIITQAEPERFPELSLVSDQAVACRNHYVHGSEAKIDYSMNFGIVVFLNDTLEYIFAASDLIEAGWNPKSWASGGSTLSHPFAAYRFSYGNWLNELKKLLPTSP